MYKKIFGLVTLLCIAVLVFNWAKSRRDDAPTTPQLAATPGGSLVFFAPNANLGILRDNKVVKHHFGFENRGHSSITIKSISVSCPCIISKPQKKLVAPGERGEIAIEVDLANQPPGSHSYRTEISYQEDGLTYTAHLHLFLQNYPKTLIIPSEIELFSMDEEPVKALFRVVSLTEEQVPVVKSIRSSSPSMSARMIEAKEKYGEGWANLLELRFAGRLFSSGMYYEKIEISTEDDIMPLQGSVIIRKSSRIHVLPQRLNLKAEKRGCRPSGKIYVKDVLEKNVVIESVTSSKDIVQFTFNKEPLPTQIITVDLKRPSTKSVDFPLQLTIRIKAPCIQQHTISVTWLP